MPDPDEALMREVAAGSETALAELYDRHADAVFGASFRLLGERQRAEDVVQEVFLILWNRAERFDPGLGSLRAWLLSIGRNRSIDRIRAAGRRPGLLVFSVLEGNAAADDGALDRSLASGSVVGGAERAADPEEAAEVGWLREAVRTALRALPDLERQALELAYLGDLSQQEIATRLGWPLGTVKTRMRRAMQRLRVSLADVLGPDRGRAFAPVPFVASGAGEPAVAEVAPETSGGADGVR